MATVVQMFLFALLVLAGASVYFMTPAERKKFALQGRDRLRDAIQGVREGRGALDPLHELLITRTKWPLVAPALVVMCVFVWMGTAFSSEPAPQWQIAAGASYAPRTTNGEWSRLVTYAFVHAGFFHLLTTIGALLSLGVILERLVGRIAFATVFFAAAVMTSAVGLWALPATTPMFGASGAVFGLYGLLLAIMVYGYLREPRLPWSSLAMKRIAAGAAPFVLYNLVSDSVPSVCELAGLATGLVAGLVITRGIVEEKPPGIRAVLVPAGMALVALLVSLPMRGTIDARPAIAGIADVETRTALEYAKAVTEFTKGRLSSKALVQLIQNKILPALKADRARIEALHGVPAEQVALVTTARQYLDLREASWQRRVEGLVASSSKILKEADRAERAALEHFDRLQQDLGKSEPAT